MTDLSNDVTSLKATIIGQISLLIWAGSACGMVFFANLPIFEILSVLFVSGFIASSIINTIQGTWKNVLNKPNYLILSGILGIIGNDIFYVLAFKSAPAAQVDLIVYLWPMMVLILTALVLDEGVGFHHILACIVALSGMYILFTVDTEIEIKSEYLWGYLWAFISSFLWSVYIVISKKYAKDTPELFAIYCACGSVFSIYMHLTFEAMVIPTLAQGIILIIMGITTHSLAYYGWDFAIKKGNFKLLSILAYTTPIISIMALIFCGFAELTKELIIATLMVFAASIISSDYFKRKISYLIIK